MFRNFVTQLEIRLRQDLPGEKAQFSMAPFSRIRISEIPAEKYQPKHSAVLILLFPQGNSINTFLIQRPEYEGVHSGQISFPGGKFEKNDIELKQTALRETFEEIGVKPENIMMIGHLTDVYITPSNFLVRPFIGFMSKRPELIIDPREVDKIIEVDLFSLNDRNKKAEKFIMQSGGYKIKTPYYDIGGSVVWGATAMMISELNVVIEQINSTFS